MRKSEGGFLADYLNQYVSLGELLLTAILIALGVNIMASGLVNTFTSIASYWFIVIGLVICLASISFLFVRIFRSRAQLVVYEGFLVHDMRDNKLIKVPRYRFTEEMNQYFTAAIVENPPEKWTTEPLKHYSTIMDDSEDASTNEGSKQIVREGIEYFLLESLSCHLSEYFNRHAFESDMLYEIKRSDLSENILSNRFLKTISKPMERRWTFMGHKDNDSICASYDDGAMYRKFDLLMPAGTSITRTAEDKLTLETQKFTITFAVRFDAVLSPLPPGFISYYLGINQPNLDVGEYMFEVEVEVRLKFGMLLSGVQRQYYDWIDSFLERLDSEISRDRFFKSIGWDSALTVLQCLNPDDRKRDA